MCTGNASYPTQCTEREAIAEHVARYQRIFDTH